MVHSVLRKCSDYLNSRDVRSKKVIKNTVLSIGVKGGSIIIGLLIIPLTINYVNATQYGIWLTISSIVSWMNFFDIGMGNGLRNRLAHSLALNEMTEARKYVSTTYAVLLLIAAVLFTILFAVNGFIDWNYILNVSDSSVGRLNSVLLIVFAGFCIQFVLQLLNTILISTHQSAFADFISFTAQLALLITIFVLKHTVAPSLHVLVTALTFVPILTFMTASIWIFNTRLDKIAPKVSLVDFKYANKILNLGGSFFIIQIGALVLFQTDNIIITRLLGPAHVTSFNVSYKLFSIVIMGFAILMTPLWSAFTDAFAKGDFIWMRKKVTQMRKIWLLIACVVIPLLFLASEPIYRLWVGKAVGISTLTSLSVALYAIVYTGMALNSYFLNGLGKVQVQKWLYIFGCIINIPLGVWMTRKMGVPGTVFANVIVLSVMMCILWIQSNKILHGAAKGVWNK